MSTSLLGSIRATTVRGGRVRQLKGQKRATSTTQRRTQLARQVEEIDEQPFIPNRLPVVSMDLLLAMSADFLTSERHIKQQWTRFRDLNKLLGGFRMGELTLVSGYTGRGKTTWLSEYSIDLAECGIKTLWGSFEVRWERLIAIQAGQLMRMPYTQAMSGENEAETRSRFKDLNMHVIQQMPGTINISDLIEAMMEARNSWSVEHFIIDNLQFLNDVDERDTTAASQMHSQNRVMASLRQFATMEHCHVTIVCHPRKPATFKGELPRLTEYDLIGQSKHIQEADNIIALQSQRNEHGKRRDFIEVLKTRHGRQCGQFEIYYDQTTKNYLTEQTAPEGIKSAARCVCVMGHGSGAACEYTNTGVSTKDSHQGRQYRLCRSCDLFEWLDEE